MPGRDPIPQVLVTADDRTGALEVAGALAALGLGPVLVSVRVPLRGAGVAVVDAASRHLSSGEAAARVCAVHDSVPLGVADAWQAHKIDSTLRGQWAHEVAALARRRPVLVVPALPTAGRVCRGGVVLVHGVPVHESAARLDPRAPVRSSRPVEHLLAAGLDEHDVVSLDVDGIAAWCDGGAGRGGRVGVLIDVEDDETLLGAVRASVASWRADPERRGVLVGPSSVAGALGQALAEEHDRSTMERGADRSPRPLLGGHVLVVIGSAHPVARVQGAALQAAGLPGVELLLAPDGDGLPEAILAGLSAAARTAMARREDSTIVLVGGDTAAAVLGDRSVLVHGTLLPGVAWGRLVDPTTGHDDGPVVITKPGAFGEPGTLVDLLRERMG